MLAKMRVLARVAVLTTPVLLGEGKGETMRRVVAILALVALLVVVLAPAALAAIQCNYNPCFGTDQRDRLLERKGQGLNDTMYGKAGGDRIDASAYIRDHDELLGRRGNDILDSRDEDGADTLKGGKGFDTCFADSGDVVYSCEDLDQPPPES